MPFGWVRRQESCGSHHLGDGRPARPVASPSGLEPPNSSVISPVWSDVSCCGDNGHTPSGKGDNLKHSSVPWIQPIAITAPGRSRTPCVKWTIGVCVLVAVVGIAVGVVGICKWQQFRHEVDRLQGQVNKFALLNEDLKNTNTALEAQVNRLDAEITKFSELSESIRKYVNESTAAFDQVLDTAHGLFANISTHLDSIRAINEVCTRFSSVMAIRGHPHVSSSLRLYNHC